MKKIGLVSTLISTSFFAISCSSEAPTGKQVTKDPNATGATGSGDATVPSEIPVIQFVGETSASVQIDTPKTLTLSWSSQGANNCTVMGGTEKFDFSLSQKQVTPTQSTQYTISCTATNNVATQSSVSVIFIEPTGVVSLTINGSQFLKASEKTMARLEWDYPSNAQNCTLSNMGSVDFHSKVTIIEVSKPATFGITCSDASGKILGSAQVAAEINIPNNTVGNINSGIDIAKTIWDIFK